MKRGSWRPQMILSTSVAVLLAALPAGAAAYTPDDYKKAANECMRVRDLLCAQTNWEYYLRFRSTDGNAFANLAIVMNQRDNHAGAIAQFERAIDLGEGTYDLFAYYADSLTKVGRIDDAIDWSYKSLAVLPKLIDVRGKLAKLLVLQKRYYEALSLLGSFDEELRSRGQSAYFEGQRIAIETALSRGGGASPTERTSLRLPSFGGHFFAPVTMGEARPAPFVVDTGATQLTVSEEHLDHSKVPYKILPGLAQAKTADGRKVIGKRVTIQALRVGPYELKDVPAFVCKDCALLFGQSALVKFDMKSTKVQGVEFLTLVERR